MNLSALQHSATTAAVANDMLVHGQELVLTSVGLGLLLTLLNVVVTRLTPRSATTPDPEAPTTSAAILLNSSNVVFLCVGVTSVMILVASDLARAFAVAAAIALVRFRIKMSESSGSTLFFAVIIGLACGVGQLRIALQLTLIFVTLQLLLVLVISRLARAAPAAVIDLSPTPSSLTPKSLYPESPTLQP